MIRAQNHAKPKRAATPAGDRKTPKKFVAAHRRFAREYVRLNGNGKQAAISAGYSARSAAAQASTLLTDPNVQRMVEQETERNLKITGLTAERVLNQVARIGFADPLKLLADDGSLLPMNLWPSDIAAAVQSVEFGLNGQVTKIRFWSKVGALGLAMRHLDLLVDRAPDAALPPDPELAAKRKRVMDVVEQIIADRLAGKNLDKPILEGVVVRQLPQPAPVDAAAPNGDQKAGNAAQTAGGKPNGKGNGHGKSE